MSSNTQHRIMLAGGGTAGHVNPLLAVADAIRCLDPDADIIALGTAVGLEADLVPQAGYQLETIEKVPFPRRPNRAALEFPRKWKAEKAKVMQYLEHQGTQVVVGFGGYASAPAYSAAHRLGIPVVIHEQNARAGMANKLGARWAQFIGTAYDATGLKPAKDGGIERVGLPLRRARGLKLAGFDGGKPVLMMIGGSLGAQSINRAVAGSARQLTEVAQIVHLTGKGKIDEVRDLVVQNAGADVLTGLGEESRPGRNYHVAQYLERIDKAFACADLVICRSGAGTVSELTALGLPAVYVPLPIGNGEQRFNALPVSDAGGGIIVDDRSFPSQWVSAQVPGLLANPARLRSYGEHAWQYGIRDAADRMAREILSIADARV